MGNLKKANNDEIKDFMRKFGISQWKLGKLLGVHENTVQRMLRDPLPEEKYIKIMQVMNKYITNQG